MRSPITHFKKEIWLRFDPGHTYLKQAFRTIFSLLIAVLFYINFPLFSQESLWMFLASVIIIQVRIGSNFIEQIISVITCGIIATILVYVSLLLNPYPVWFMLYLSIGSGVMVLMAKGQVLDTIKTTLTFLFAIVSGGISLISTHTYERPLMFLLGVFCAVIASCLWPSNKKKESLIAGEIYFKSLFLLIEQELLILNSPLNVNINYKTEQKLQERRDRVTRHFNILQDKLTNYKYKSNKQNIVNFELSTAHLYDMVLALGNWRYFNNSIKTTKEKLEAIDLIDKQTLKIKTELNNVSLQLKQILEWSK
tara:strand:+ start:132 stop:1058 length:927 start_codon:yes stop_codon:yes gene_type:complete